jgi:hypothetical protein
MRLWLTGLHELVDQARLANALLARLGFSMHMMLKRHDSRNNIINQMTTRGRDCDRESNARLVT